MSIANDRKKRTDDNGWAIAEAKAREEIAKAKARIGTLESSLKIFIKKKKSGEPWPGSNSPQER